MLRLLATLLLTPGLASGAVPRSSVELTFTDPAIVESSGLVVDGSAARGGLFVTTNDSGDSGRVFSVDPATGDTVGVATWSRDPVDVEALAPAGPGEVWVGDIGDNDAERASVSVARVRVGRGDTQDDPAAVYELVYPDGPRDAETLLVDPEGRLLIVTKGLLGGQFLRSEVSLDRDRPNPMTTVGVALPIATDGAFFPDGRHLVVRGYGSAVVYAYPSLEEVADFALPAQEQGEGIAVDASGAVFVSSEGERSDVLRVRLPRSVQRAVEPQTSSRSRAPSPSPATVVEPPPPPTPDGGQAGVGVASGPTIVLAGLAASAGLALLLTLRWVLRRRRPGG